MCVKSSLCFGSNNKYKKSDNGNSSGSELNFSSGNTDLSTSRYHADPAIIPTQNKSLCTSRNNNPWIITQSGIEIKLCKECKYFRPWAAFGQKELVTKYSKCQEHKHKKYAFQKEEKKKNQTRTVLIKVLFWIACHGIRH